MKSEEIKQEKIKKEMETDNINDDEPDDLGVDIYAGNRIHCWVLLKKGKEIIYFQCKNLQFNNKKKIKGKRDVKETVFIEPSTGRIYPLEFNPYECVDAVFNHENFWINLDMDLPVKEVDFHDMYNAKKWEFVMLESGYSEKDKVPDEEKESAEEVKEDFFNELGDLDMPPPW